MSDLVLSLFPGLDGLGQGFEAEGYCVVAGPDVLLGRDIRGWHPVAGPWGGVIGGPPCTPFTQLRHLNPRAGLLDGNQIPEFERVVAEAAPAWFVMENVPAAPEPRVAGYSVYSVVLNNRWLGDVQERTRRFSFGTPDGRPLLVEVALFESPDYMQAVTSASRMVPVKLLKGGKVKRTYTAEQKRRGPDTGPRMSVGDMLELQGYPRDMLDRCPFTESGKRKAIGNMVPLGMARVVARAVKRALTERTEAAA